MNHAISTSASFAAPWNPPIPKPKPSTQTDWDAWRYDAEQTIYRLYYGLQKVEDALDRGRAGDATAWVTQLIGGHDFRPVDDGEEDNE